MASECRTLRVCSGTRKVDVRLPGKGNSNSHGARPVHLIITMIKWIRTSRLSIKNSLQVFDYDLGGKPSYIGNAAVILEPLKNAGVILVPPSLFITLKPGVE